MNVFCNYLIKEFYLLFCDYKLFLKNVDVVTFNNSEVFFINNNFGVYMRRSTTKSAKNIFLRAIIARVMLFALFASTEVAKSQNYCNPYNRYVYYGYVRGVHFYNTSGSVNWS